MCPIIGYILWRVHTRRDDSIGFPLPEPIPYAHKNIAHVTATPMSEASIFPISGNVVILQRKYTDDDMIEPDITSNAIYPKPSALPLHRHTDKSLPSTYRSYSDSPATSKSAPRPESPRDCKTPRTAETPASRTSRTGPTAQYSTARPGHLPLPRHRHRPKTC